MSPSFVPGSERAAVGSVDAAAAAKLAAPNRSRMRFGASSPLAVDDAATLAGRLDLPLTSRSRPDSSSSSSARLRFSARKGTNPPLLVPVFAVVVVVVVVIVGAGVVVVVGMTTLEVDAGGLTRDSRSASSGSEDGSSSSR